MAHGTPKGKVAKVFTDRVDSLEAAAKAQSKAFQQAASTRPWHTPAEMKEQDLLDVPNLHEPAWNRDELNQIYSEKILNQEDSGTHGDLVATKKQIDFMAVEERAWRLRHASCVRCNVLAHGRLSGHGTTNESIFSMLKNSIENDLLQGAEGPPAPIGDFLRSADNVA
jgi:hypothetical protein